VQGRQKRTLVLSSLRSWRRGRGCLNQSTCPKDTVIWRGIVLSNYSILARNSLHQTDVAQMPTRANFAARNWRARSSWRRTERRWEQGIPEHKVKLVGALIDWRKATDCESKYPNHLRYAQHPATDPGCF
jgi:hypothetical protein